MQFPLSIKSNRARAECDTNASASVSIRRSLVHLRRGFNVRTRSFVLLILVSGILAVSISALAHHGEANYDTSAVVDVKGTVTDFQFINPHVLIHIDARDSGGNME